MADLLPQDLGDVQKTSVNYPVGETDSVGILDGNTGAPIARLGGVAVGEKGQFLRANRELLREHLSQHLEVTTGKNLTHYAEDAKGVTAFFADGSSVRGAVLIGADGAFSNVRLQLLGPSHKPVLSRNIPINGLCKLPHAEYESLRQFGNSVLFAAIPGVFFNIGLCSIQPDRSSAEFYWGVAFPSDNPDRDSKWVQEADRKTLYDKCVDLTRGMPSNLTDIILKTGPEGISLPPIKFVEYVTPEAFPKANRVALLGDSAHTMIPFRGAGANTAIADACDLARLIIEGITVVGQGWSGVDKILDKYNSIMAPRGRDMVLSSRAAGQNDQGITGIMQGRVDTSERVKANQPTAEGASYQSEIEKLRPIFRHITTHNASGKAVFSTRISSDAPVRKVVGGDMEFSLMYTNSTFPVNMFEDNDMAGYISYLEHAPAITIPGGTVCRTVDFAPGYTSPMHRTVSCDFGVVLEGEIELMLDSGESRVLKRGDVAVQRGTNHAWRNMSLQTWCRMLYVLQAAEPVTVKGANLNEDEGGID